MVMYNLCRTKIATRLITENLYILKCCHSGWHVGLWTREFAWGIHSYYCSIQLNDISRQPIQYIQLPYQAHIQKDGVYKQHSGS